MCLTLEVSAAVEGWVADCTSGQRFDQKQHQHLHVLMLVTPVHFMPSAKQLLSDLHSVAGHLLNRSFTG